jgi:alpha-ketoglutarate-dependent taurine dioxygenase
MGEAIRTRFLNQKRLPLVIEPGNGGSSRRGLESPLSVVVDGEDFLRRNLLEFGAVLLRGFKGLGAHEFAQFVREFSGKDPLDYVAGAAPRIKLGGGVYTSTEYPQRYTLSLHNELSYTYRWPDHLYFCCVTAPKQGGETPLGDSRAILKNIDAEVVRRFKSKQVMYVRNLHGGAGTGYSWQEAFETDDRSAVEEYCYAGGVRFKWKDDGGLWLSEVRPATATHPTTGEEVWFNQADGFHPSGMDPETYKALTSTTREDQLRLNAYFGDGTPLDLSALENVREVMRKEMALVSWRRGDILIVDNMLASHGRMPFTGPRKILLAMT